MAEKRRDREIAVRKVTTSIADVFIAVTAKFIRAAGSLNQGMNLMTLIFHLPNC